MTDETGTVGIIRQEADFLLYQTEDGATRVEVRFIGETAWLSKPKTGSKRPGKKKR